jgi:hypothetical protein
MAGKKEVMHTFKMCEEMSDWMAKEIVSIDRSKSEVIRCALLLSLDTIRNNPSLIDHVRYEDHCKSY